MSAIIETNRYTLEEQTLLKHSSWPPRTRTINCRKVALLTITNAHTQIALNSTLGIWQNTREQGKRTLRAPSPIHQHCSTTGHPVSPDCFTIVHREPQGITRNIKEAMFIRVDDPSLNRNIGKYKLPHIWDQILQDTPTLQLK